MEDIEDIVAKLVKRIAELEERERNTIQRITGIEQAYAQLNNTYNNHISGLHVQRIG